MHPISPHVWLAIIAVGLAVAAFLMFFADYEARNSITATRTATMHLYHIDSLTGPEELHIWCDSFDNAWRWALLTDTFANTNLGDMRVRRLHKNHEIARFNSRTNPAAPYEIATKKPA